MRLKTIQQQIALTVHVQPFLIANLLGTGPVLYTGITVMTIQTQENLTEDYVMQPCAEISVPFTFSSHLTGIESSAQICRVHLCKCCWKESANMVLLP